MTARSNRVSGMLSGPGSAGFARSFVFLLSFITGWTAYAAQSELSKLPRPAQKRIDFVRDIQPILSMHCYSCHGAEKQENELRWDRKVSALKGGSSGPAIIPGKSAESRVIHLVSGLEKNLVMPKKGSG